LQELFLAVLMEAINKILIEEQVLFMDFYFTNIVSFVKQFKPFAGFAGLF